MKLFIFGSTGDLVRKKIIPAFMGLKLKDLEIIALGRRELTNETYEDFICNGKCFKDFKHKPIYRKIEMEGEISCENCEELLDKSKDNFFYIAMPPEFIEEILTYLARIKEKGFRIKILIEKPFGSNLEDAKRLKRLISNNNLAGDVSLSDHYLFKEEIVKLKRQDFKRMKIVSLENVGLEKRIYYDHVGALKDMVQSHFLNIIFKLLRNPQEELSDFHVLEYKRGQYGNGHDKGYVKELGKKSDTETFVKVRLKIRDKEFEIITGKGFDKKLAFIEIDGKRTYFESLHNAYGHLFLDFFSQNKENFANMDNSILAWEIIDKIESKKPKLEYYPEGSSSEEASDF